LKKWLLLAGLLLVAYVLTGVRQVLPGEQAVVRRFGRVLPYQPKPGLWIGLPFGMDRVDRVPVDRVRNVVVGYQDEQVGETIPAGQMLTGDHNLVNIKVTLYYKVKADEVAAYVMQSDRVEATLSRAAEAVMGEWAAGRTVDNVLLNGKREMRSDLVEQTQKRIEPYQFGVRVLDAQVGLIAPPEEVKSAFDNVARAQTTIATKVNQAEQEGLQRYRTAEAYRFRLQQEAAADARSQVLLAGKEADSFKRRLGEYEKGRLQNPAYLQQIWQEERGKLFARLKENKQLGLLDHHLGPDGLDLTIAPPVPQK
jgi:modulator of FtsH protease HflK